MIRMTIRRTAPANARSLPYSHVRRAQIVLASAAGGLILFNADCADQEFVNSIVGATGIGKKLFPKYEFRELPAEHPIFTRQQFLRKNWKNPPSVLALSNGVFQIEDDGHEKFSDE